MARVVLDTNVLVSAFLVVNGRSAEVLHRVISGFDELFISGTILEELARVLISKLKLDESLCQSYLSLVGRYARVVVPKEKVTVIVTDETDNRILECAIEANAQFIVSGDKRHLLPLGVFRGMRIMSPAEYLKLDYGS